MARQYTWAIPGQRAAVVCVGFQGRDESSHRGRSLAIHQAKSTLRLWWPRLHQFKQGIAIHFWRGRKDKVPLDHGLLKASLNRVSTYPGQHLGQERRTSSTEILHSSSPSPLWYLQKGPAIPSGSQLHLWEQWERCARDAGWRASIQEKAEQAGEQLAELGIYAAQTSSQKRP